MSSNDKSNQCQIDAFGQKDCNQLQKNQDECKLEFQSRALILPTQKKTLKEHDERLDPKHSTSYMETLMHLLKGNIGSGIFAMGYALKNSGIVLGPILIVAMGLVCVHCQHLLVNASNRVKQNLNLLRHPDFATTVEMCFATGPTNLQNCSKYMRKTINTFLCLTQLGFCCVYFVFMGTNVKQILDYYGFVYSVQAYMAIVLVPILLSCLVRNLKYLAPFSVIANFFMLIGIIITLYYSCQRPFAHVEAVAKLEQFPLFFGTALYAFEGIGLVLPLQNEMKKPKHFDCTLGVLNVGMTMVAILVSLIGFFGYLKYGNDVQGSVTLNLPKDEILAQSVKAILTLGVLLTFALQFYIPIDIMFPVIQEQFGPFTKPVLTETIFRTVIVLMTFALAELIPFLDLFISLVGSFCSTAIALIFPPVLEFITKSTSSEITPLIILKNTLIIIFGLLGCATGSYESIRLILKAFKDGRDQT